MNLLRKLIYYSGSGWKMLGNLKGWLPVFLSLLTGKKTSQRMVLLRQPKLKFSVRSAMDVWSIKETFLDEFYTKYGVQVQDGWTVIDIGAGVGDFSIYAAYSNPTATIYAFEPFPGSYELLRKNLVSNYIENVHTFQLAVWHSDGELLLEGTENEPLQITSETSDSGDEAIPESVVQATALDTILEKHGIEEVDLIKLDCEGAEYDILMKAPSSVLNMIKRIIMEYHDLDAERSHMQLVQFFENHGFRVRRFRNPVHDHIGYLYVEQE